MKQVKTERPSFPAVEKNVPLGPFPPCRWQVVCGDDGHWRVGLYSPEFSSLDEISELEQHSCPELFWLVSGRIVLVLGNGGGGLKEVPLEQGRPVLVTAPHSAYCPDGPYTGLALVVERDEFVTEYFSTDELICS